MTEDQAKKTECPIYVSMVSFAVMRADEPSVCASKLADQVLCRGRMCMMWRSEKDSIQLTGKPIPVKQSDGQFKIEPEAITIHNGYCGLAGKP